MTAPPAFRVVASVHHKGSEVSRVRVTFASIPDAPLSKVAISFFGGKRGLLENSANLCAHPQHATLKFVAQNNMRLQSEPKLKTSCG